MAQGPAKKNIYLIHNGLEILKTDHIHGGELTLGAIDNKMRFAISHLADLHLMSWVARDRSKKLTVFGPEGIENVTKGFELAYTYDSLYRNEHHGDTIAPLDVVGYEPFTLQGDSVIYDENDLKITAFLVSHKPVDPAYGFRFDYKGRSIVISGDTIYDENLIKYAKQADLLFHEAISYELMRISSRIASEL